MAKVDRSNFIPDHFEAVDLWYCDDDKKAYKKTYFVPVEFCVPRNLHHWAYMFKAFMVTCSKYGCRQFLPIKYETKSLP